MANAASCSSARGTSISAPPGAPGRSPIALARNLFERETGDGYGTFDGAAWLYADVLGEAGLAEYRRLATEAWEKLPPLNGRRREKADGDYYGLSGILDSFAERDGDVETRIALRAKDLSSPWKYLELAEFCLKHKGANEALSWAEEGLWAFEDGPSDTRLVLFAAEPSPDGRSPGRSRSPSQARFRARAGLQCLPALARDGRRGGSRPGARAGRGGRRPRPGSPSATPPILASKF